MAERITKIGKALRNRLTNYLTLPLIPSRQGRGTIRKKNPSPLTGEGWERVKVHTQGRGKLPA
jgi:hypothetical protein